MGVMNSSVYGRGVIAGKFCPPHLGHHYLIETAAMLCEQLTVLVVDTPVVDFDVPVQQRALWLAEMHPNVTIRVMPDILQDDRSDLWADYTHAFLGYYPEKVFSSEDYGDTWAAAMGAVHIKVDKARERVPISATKIRQDPLSHLDYLHPIVRAHYVKRVAVVGAESTGTTTLSRALAQHYKTTWVPEFGRLRDEQAFNKTGKLLDWPTTDFSFTALTQQAMEDRLARKANRLLVCDTDALATALWHERYHGFMDPVTMRLAESRDYALYIVTDCNIPAEQDGYRFEMHKRPEMQQRFVDELVRLNRNHIIVTGSHAERMATATRAINNYMVGAKIGTRR